MSSNNTEKSSNEGKRLRPCMYLRIFVQIIFLLFSGEKYHI